MDDMYGLGCFVCFGLGSFFVVVGQRFFGWLAGFGVFKFYFVFIFYFSEIP